MNPMKKSKRTKQNLNISLKRLAELRRATLIASTGSSIRLAGSKVADEQIAQILNKINTPSEQK